MLRKLSSVLLVFLFYQINVFAQDLTYEQGTLLLQLSPEVNIKSFVHQWSDFDGKKTDLTIEKELIPNLNIWELSFDFTALNDHQFLEAIRKDRYTWAAQFNHYVANRQNIPNDALFGNQWHHINLGGNGGIEDADMDTDLAWDLTTGGLTIDGDTIVVAVLDDGIDPDHPDLLNNLWYNSGEIPNNGTDDDNNGYTDDYDGWNINTNSDFLTGGAHGMPVAGIIGAVGNNGIGLTGVNWDVKVMIVKNNFNTSEAGVLEAYAYPLALRTRFNDSAGAEGALVVATNASWGVDGGDPDDSPLWCNLYDQLGEVGILNCGATANNDVDVDVEGDLPTGCSSDYLITVTNMRRNDVKEPEAGYGALSIDLGAFGTEVFTLGNNNNYTTFGGTSGATPQVTGAVALLYSAPCPDVSALYKSDPAAAALLIKEYILEGVDPNPSLDNITTTGGRLNVFNSVQLVIDNCSPCLPPYNLELLELTTSAVTLEWTASLDANSTTLRWREVGTLSWTVLAEVDSPYLLSDLEACIDYEFQVEGNCVNVTSGFSNSFLFRTDGCCVAPEDINVHTINLDAAMITFDSVTAASSYNVLLTNLNDNQNQTFTTTENELDFTGLESCTPYLVQIQSFCADGELTDYNNGTTFTTFGCGACIDFNYCPSAGEESTFEWIDSFSFNSLINNSGSDGGYGNYTGTFTEVETYGTYTISLTPAFAGPSYDEYFKVWIDYNQNGIFEDATELVFNPNATTRETITEDIMIPGTALPGLTRIRVSMKYIGGTDLAEPEACSQFFDFGEVEDYCLKIEVGATPACDLPINLEALSTTTFGATVNWEDPTEDHENHNIKYRLFGTFNWIEIQGISPPFQLSSLEPCEEYEVQVSANCVDSGTSGYTQSLVFETACTINSNNLITNPLEVTLAPNPADDFLVVTVKTPETNLLKIDLVSLDGKRFPLLENHFVEAGTQQLTLEEMTHFAAGLYWLVLETEDAVVWEKVVLGH